MQGRLSSKPTPGPAHGGGPTLTILCYHAITPHKPPLDDYCFLSADTFRDHMRWLRRSRLDVVALKPGLDALFQGRLRRNAVAITFDDGYRNNIDIALPSLEALGLNATIFLTTGFTGTGATLWPNRIVLALLATSEAAVTWAGETMALGDTAARARANARLQALVKRQAPGDPDAAVSDIEQRLLAPRDPQQKPDSPFAMMSAKDIERGQKSGLLDFGAHTLRHPILSALDDAALEREINHSISQVETLTARKCETFAYPNGRPQDFDQRAVSLLAAGPARYGLTTVDDQNRATASPYQIARWTIGQNTSLRQLQARFMRARLRSLLGRSGRRS